MINIYTITYSADKFDENNLNKQDILTLINVHQGRVVPQLMLNKQYYLGDHAIKQKQRSEGAPNSKIVCNHAKDIADNATGYFMGNPITYNNTSSNDNIEPLLLAFDNADVDDTDFDNALDMSIYGVAYEYVYVKQDETEIMTKNLEAENTFVVYDDTIEQNPLFGVYYYQQNDDATGQQKYLVEVLTKTYKYQLSIMNNSTQQDTTEEPQQHFMADIPIIEYKNNKYNIGDFEQQISLIDAYNTLMSDRVNDKEQFIDAILVLYGSQLGDDVSETSEAVKSLKEARLLELPMDSKAEYLIRTLDENGMETLKKAIKEDIYTFSHIPNLTDENFVGNSSGVAMEYKLLGLEMITKIKTRYYKHGLRKRIQLFCNYLGLKQLIVDANTIIPAFSRALPKNLVELSQVVVNMQGIVGQRTLLQLLPFVEDPDAEIESTNKEKEENLKQQQEAFGIGSNAPPDQNGVNNAEP